MDIWHHASNLDGKTETGVIKAEMTFSLLYILPGWSYIKSEPLWKCSRSGCNPPPDLGGFLDTFMLICSKRVRNVHCVARSKHVAYTSYYTSIKTFMLITCTTHYSTRQRNQCKLPGKSTRLKSRYIRRAIRIKAGTRGNISVQKMHVLAHQIMHTTHISKLSERGRDNTHGRPPGNPGPRVRSPKNLGSSGPANK